MMKVDLHTHTSVSDGRLSAAGLLAAAMDKRIDILSITDHDTIAAYRELEHLDTGAMQLIAGIEFSTQWRGVGIHIVGLGIDLQDPALLRGVEFQSRAREDRALKIARRLQKALAIEDPLPGVRRIAGDSAIGRPHFARHLLDIGVADNMETVFKKYLGRGKIGDVKDVWAELPRIIEWITGAGGIAVLAHPLKYQLTARRFSSLLDEFTDAGGAAMEVVSGQQKPEDTARLARLCNGRDLLASCGSDFHDPDHAWGGLGEASDLPADCAPVWESLPGFTATRHQDYS